MNSYELKRAVFLDRDGVLNRSIVQSGKPYAPLTLDQFQILPGAAEALQQLKAAGFVLVVVTNQPDVGTGKLSSSLLEKMHQQMRAVLPLDLVEVCIHVDKDQCECRKPKPSMILSSAKKFGVDLSQSFMVGDRWRDIEAGQNAGCKTVWIKTDYAEQKPSGFDFEARDLEQAAKWILSSALKSQSR